MGKYTDVVKLWHPDETLAEQLLVLMYELGDLAKSIQRMHTKPQFSSLYLIEAKKAIADLIAQLHLTC